ncbi:MAG: DUF5689 domain-containing protein [Flavobacterium sp.]|nr:DUF5689 domain-containing protein [Flavobacterium sp.]
MKNNKFLLAFSVAIALAATIVVSCNKKFDEPPFSNVDPNITVNTTIKALKAKHTVSGAYDDITTDVTIAGVVVADDKSGNIYKNLYIQDTSGAITLLLDANSLYGTYPVGRRVFINCKGLTVTDYNGMIQLGIKANINGSPSVEGIPSSVISKYLTGGTFNNPVVAKQVTVSQLGTNMQDPNLGTLIQLSNYEFVKGDISKTFADTSQYKNSTNITINDCSGTAGIIIRSSGYANFAAVKPPSGNGTIAAIYTIFSTTKQLVLRDTSDIKFTGARCNLFEEDFNAYATTGTTAAVIPGWKNIMETGDVPYTLAAFSGSVFPKISAFTSAALPTTNISTWLISPEISLPTGTTPKLSFTCSRRYTAGTFKVYVSTNFTGANVSTATWTLITTVPAGTATVFTPFELFGPFSLLTYAGQKINIGFRYEAPAGTAAGTVGTYEPDDIKIKI